MRGSPWPGPGGAACSASGPTPLGRPARRALLALGPLDVRASLPDRRRLTDRGRLADVGFADRLTLALSRFPLGPLLGQIAGHEVRIHGKTPTLFVLENPCAPQ